MTAFTDHQAAVESVYFDWPAVARTLNLGDLSLSWQMEYQERMTLVAIVENLRPTIAVEVGTHSGGSLAVLSRYAERVWSLDIEPESSRQLHGRFSNVEFVVGDSKQTLPGVLEIVQAEQDGPVFVLIDGDHSTEGAYSDLTNVLALRPSHPVVVVTHDSFNPDVRAGILKASWSTNPHVHYVETDFQLGSLYNRLEFRHQMWGGFCLAILQPEQREDDLVVSQRHALLFDTVFARSAHNTSLRGRVGRKARAVRRRLAR